MEDILKMKLKYSTYPFYPRMHGRYEEGTVIMQKFYTEKGPFIHVCMEDIQKTLSDF